METLLWTVIGFLLGSIPFSLLLGKLIIHKDIRQYDDNNSGAVSVWKAGGSKVGIFALILDYLKGVIPVGIAYFVYKIPDWGLVSVALAPVLGHAFSPFLKFRGGKAIATTFGIWTGMTLWQGPTMLGAFLGISFIFRISDAWSVMMSMLGLLIYLMFYFVFWGFDHALFFIWMGNIMILAWKHHKDLRKFIRVRMN